MAERGEALERASDKTGFSASVPFRWLVQSVTDYAIYMLDSDGRVVSWNAGAERLKGYTEQEIIGQNFSRFFTEEDRKNGFPQRALEEAHRVGRFEAEGWRIRKDGSRFWANAVIDAIYDDDGAFIGFAKITRDVSERKAAERILAESEWRFRTLVQGVIDYAIYLLDPSGIVINWNAGAERMKGYRAEEIVGRHFSAFYTPEDRTAGVPAKALETASREGRFEAESWRVRKDGTRFFASVVIDAIRDERGEFVGFAKITRDITARRKADDELRDSERQFRLLVNGVTDYALYMLDLNGNITSWNLGAARIKGYSADEIIGEHFSKFYSEEDRVAGAPARALATAMKSGRYEAEGWRVRKDGTFLWASVIIDAIRDEDDKLVGFAKITRDITERREAQLALQKMHAQLAEAQKMDALGQLTGGVAHDFNNLLMVISGHVNTLKKLTANDPKGARAAEAVQIAAQRGAALTRQLLTFSRRQRVNPVPIEIADQVAAFRDVLTTGLGSSVRLAVDIPPTTWAIKVDVNEFEIALVNLVLNARDAMPQGGTVAITAENVDIAASNNPAAVSGEHVALTISDTGVGIAPDVLGKIFDPFFTTKAVGKGTGLGLSQVFGFAHQAGGTVTAESTLGSGTRITMCLPRTNERLPGVKDAPSEVNVSAVGTVLLVEDNPDVAIATTGLLEHLGYEVQSVVDAESALSELQSNGAIEIVLSDIVMPGHMDGLALARAIRAKYAWLPVLLVTGYSDSVRNVNDEFPILRKPYEINDLSAAIAKLCADNNLLQFKPKKRH